MVFSLKVSGSKIQWTNGENSKFWSTQFEAKDNNFLDKQQPSRFSNREFEQRKSICSILEMWVTYSHNLWVIGHQMNHLEMNHLKISNRNDGHSKKRLVGRAGELEGTEARGLKLKKFSKNWRKRPKVWNWHSQFERPLSIGASEHLSTAINAVHSEGEQLLN